MNKFHVGALRRANSDARVAAANDLVNRTLSQHGLLPNGGGLTTAMPDLLSRFQATTIKVGSPNMAIPQGATFKPSQFSCAEGSRDLQTYVPSTASRGITGIVVMLHGCTQNSTDFAAGTGMNALAEQHGFVVIYPQQSRGNNAQSCWNWFSRGDQRRGKGEPAILAGMTREAMAKFDVPKERTFVAGLSAGAAMAVILGETYPDIFSAVGAHSGLAFGAATDVASAFAAMAGGMADTGRGAISIPTIVFHGSADSTVVPANGAQIARHVLDNGPRQTFESETQEQEGGRQFRRKVVTGPDGTPLLEHWVVDGLGHAWSGGQPQGSYIDAKGPNASAEMIRFFYETNRNDT